MLLKPEKKRKLWKSDDRCIRKTVGGNKSLKEIYVDGCCEISDIGKEYKRLFKEVKQMKKGK